MCLEDIRLGRKGQYQSGQTTVSTSAALAIPRNELRTHLLISADGGKQITIFPAKAPPGGAGIVLSTSLPFIDLDVKDHGQAVIDDWYAVVASTTAVLSWVETILADK